MRSLYLDFTVFCYFLLLDNYFYLSDYFEIYFIFAYDYNSDAKTGDE